MMQDCFPAHMVLEVTSRCNLRCKGCAFHGPEAFVTRPTGDMKEEIWRAAIREAGGWGHEVQLAVNGGGEPLLHPRLKDIVSFALSFPSLKVGFLTNGMLLDRDWASFLVGSGMDWIALSIDGLSPDTHRLVRKGSDLRMVEKNLAELLKEKERAGVNKPDISLNMVAYDEVKDQKEAFIERWINRVDHVMVSHYRSPPSSKRWPGVPAEEKAMFAPVVSNGDCMGRKAGAMLRRFQHGLFYRQGRGKTAAGNLEWREDVPGAWNPPAGEIWGSSHVRDM